MLWVFRPLLKIYVWNGASLRISSKQHFRKNSSFLPNPAGPNLHSMLPPTNAHSNISLKGIDYWKKVSTVLWAFPKPCRWERGNSKNRSQMSNAISARSPQFRLIHRNNNDVKKNTAGRKVFKISHSYSGWLSALPRSSENPFRPLSTPPKKAGYY